MSDTFWISAAIAVVLLAIVAIRNPSKPTASIFTLFRRNYMAEALGYVINYVVSEDDIKVLLSHTSLSKRSSAMNMTRSFPQRGLDSLEDILKRESKQELAAWLAGLHRLVPEGYRSRVQLMVTALCLEKETFRHK